MQESRANEEEVQNRFQAGQAQLQPGGGAGRPGEVPDSAFKRICEE